MTCDISTSYLYQGWRKAGACQLQNRQHWIHLRGILFFEMDSVSSITSIVEELKKKVASAEQYTRQFLLLCRDYTTRILNSRNPAVFMNHFIQAWFKSFLAFKDEVLLLIQGAIHRRYHEAEHQTFSHERDSDSKTGCEARFYTNYRFLTACSADGVKYLAHHAKKSKVTGTDSFSPQNYFKLVIFGLRVWGSCKMMLRSFLPDVMS